MLKKTLTAVVAVIVLASVVSAKEMQVTATAYCFDSITATGDKPAPGTIAVSRDMLNNGWEYGDTVEVDGLGCFVIKDVMHKRKRKSVDIYVRNKKQAREFGRQEKTIKKKAGQKNKKDIRANGTPGNDRPENRRQSTSAHRGREDRNGVCRGEPGCHQGETLFQTHRSKKTH